MQTLLQLLVISIIFGVFYYLIIRPQSVRQKQRRHLIEELVKGDKIVTVGGIIGTIKNINEETITLQTGDVILKMSRSSVASKVEKGSKESRSK